MGQYVPTRNDDFDAIQIRLASPEMIRSWSFGEVRKPETINYRTFKPEKDGLFCERIFGPVKDWECSCGKYKKVKHRGIVCDRCGVEITEQKVRRERMGHITLASPVSHIWFFKTTPSTIGNLLDLSVRLLEKIIYFEEYTVLDPGESALTRLQTLTEDEYRDALEEEASFEARMGAEAIRELLEEIDLEEMCATLRQDFKVATSKQKRRKIIKRLKVAENMKHSGNRPEWTILNVIPVIPPDLRPLVPLEGGRYATSDLNDLYRRVINRNNRLKRLIELKAPEVIVRNEKRMLQEAVDALFDNGRHGRTVLGAGNRPLKSLSDMLKGKQGRFRQNLLGKRVDYSGRSVIVVGPELKLHQCGLPKKMALELFEPFIMHELRERGIATTIKAAKKAISQGRPEVWDILEEVIREHPVLLNRAPTLHRLGIQAFEPVLIEGKAIRIHPLVCAAFNADFDGDQMAVHIPLMPESQLEARVLMLASNNIFSPSNGRPIVTPSQDIVLGIAYLTKRLIDQRGEGQAYASANEVIMAYEAGHLQLHAQIKLGLNGSLIETTVGRVLFNEIIPAEVGFVNKELNKGSVGDLISQCFHAIGHDRTVEVLDELKRLGFQHATTAGISIAMEDMQIPTSKPALVAGAQAEVEEIDAQYQQGLITEGERNNKIIDVWTQCTEQVSDDLFKQLDRGDEGFNPIFLMANSGARGSKPQIRQLAGMRGLMAKPSGDIIETPILSNFREGLSVLEYFISTHGARKGLADTALKTADAGYLTRRLVDVSQDVIITIDDCGTLNGINVEPLIEAGENVAPLSDRIDGRVAAEDVYHPVTKAVIVEEGAAITPELAAKVEDAGIELTRIRSVLTCEAERGVCAKCYGRNLATGESVELGEPVGIIAAQSIGEPGTQLTMRTFHIGGTASRAVEQADVRARVSGTLQYHNLEDRTVTNRHGAIVAVNRGGDLAILDENGVELERHGVNYAGTNIHAIDGATVQAGQQLMTWDPYVRPIITASSGTVKYEDVVENVTMLLEEDATTGRKNKIIREHKEDLHPQLTILAEDGAVKDFYPIPQGAVLSVEDGDSVESGDELAKTPRQITKTKDITGGLPRVAELFEARRPKDPAIITEIDGSVELGGYQKGMRKIRIIPPAGKEAEYLIPHGKHLNVHAGDRVLAGQQLIDGPIVPEDILRVSGEKKLQEYLLNEVQEVYRLQGVNINDKHIEIIIRQMLKKVRIEKPGETDFLVDENVDKVRFGEENQRVLSDGGEPATAQPVLLGITKASLSTESFIAAASFQQTTRVLTDAAVSGKIDTLRGLKENVIIGHLIPAGTGCPEYLETYIRPDEPEPVALDDLEGEGVTEESVRAALFGPS